MTAVDGASRMRALPRPLRAALVLAVAGQVLVILASFGLLAKPAMLIVAIAAAAAIVIARPIPWWLLLALIPLAILASYPPLAFDETLYHLPYIRGIAESGSIQLRDDIRFGVFPLIHELLCVPLFVVFGATATHFVAWLELAILGALLLEWPRRREAGWLAAAIVLGNPAMLANSAITYVDAALTLFVAAGFFCLRNDAAVEGDPVASAISPERALLAGFFLGTATGVKYLGWMFVAAALLSVGRRRIPQYLLGVLAGAAPMLLRIVTLTGNPLHPYFMHSAWDATEAIAEGPVPPAIRFARLLFDLTFDRQRVGGQPPYTPLFAAAVLLVIVAGKRWRLAAICVAYFAAFIAVMPADSRYLLPLVPLVSVAAAELLATRISPRVMAAIALIAVSPLVLYPAAHIARRGLPPLRAEARQAMLEREIRGLRVLERTGPGRVYVCGAEDLKYFGGDRLIGDHFGPFAYKKVFNGGLSTLDAQWFLVSSKCPDPWRAQIAAIAERVDGEGEVSVWRRRVLGLRILGIGD